MCLTLSSYCVSECVHRILMRWPPAQSCAVNVYVLTAVKLWLVTFALVADSYGAMSVHVSVFVCVWVWVCVYVPVFCSTCPPQQEKVD